MFIPGFVLTLALWPITRREVYEEILKILEEKNPSEVCFIGSQEEYEDLLDIVKSKYKLKIYDTRSEKIETSVDEVESADTLIVTEKSSEVKITPDKTIIDLTGGISNAISIEDSIDTLERITLSFGLSIALVPLIGLILNYTPFGIRFKSVLVSLILVIGILLGVYYYRRKGWSTSKLSQSD
jgi:uncharacterized membrane protein